MKGFSKIYVLAWLFGCLMFATLQFVFNTPSSASFSYRAGHAIFNGMVWGALMAYFMRRRIQPPSE